MKFRLSINTNLVNKGDPRLRGWKNAEMDVGQLADHITLGYAFSQGVLKPEATDKKPSIKDVAEAQLLPIDIDNTVKVYNASRKSYEERCKTIEEGYYPFDEAAADYFLQNNALMIYTTPSHSSEHHRFRIIFLLPGPVHDPLEYSKIAEAFIEKYGSDRSCKNIDRLFYGSKACAMHVFGQRLSKRELERIKGAADEEYRVEVEHKKSGLNGGDISSKLVADMLNYIPKQMSYDEWGKIVSAIGNYFDEDVAIKLIDDWSPDDKMGTAYRIRHRSKKPGIASVIWMAKQHGFDTRELYNGDYSETRVTSTGKLIGKQSGRQRYNLTDMGNSERLADIYGNKIRYNHKSGNWHIWTGKVWQVDEKGKIMQYAKKTIRKIYGEISQVDSREYAAKLAVHATKSEASGRLEAMVKMTKTIESISTVQDDYDKDLYLLNLQNGVYNLKSNELVEHTPELLLSKICNAEFIPNANCYLWEDALLTFFDNNIELVEFVQRAVGLSMCGAQLEEVMFFAHGAGKNGKSIFFKVLQLIFGDYFQKAPTEMLMLRYNEGSIPNDIARLPGARLVIAEELPENRSFDENKIKNLTGGDLISARFLHKEFFDFQPTHTLWVYGNHKPTIKGTDEGIWRRIHMIPFNVTIPEKERRPQQELMADFELEKSGILNWMIEGWKQYQQIGLKPPAIVKQTTKEYRAEMDKIGDFVQECCELNAANKIKASDLLTGYFEYCNKFHDKPLPKNKFYKRIELLDGVSSFNGTKNAKCFMGIELNKDYSEAPRAF